MTRVQQSAMSILFVAVLILGGWAWSQDNVPSPSDLNPATAGQVLNTGDDAERSPASTATSPTTAREPSVSAASKAPLTHDLPASQPVTSKRRQGVMVSFWIFILAVFLGIELISKVPPTLHTPLMSGSNAISGITLVGAVIVAAAMVEGLSTTAGVFARFLGFIAVTLAMINAVGGFLVTHRMLAMFTRK